MPNRITACGCSVPKGMKCQHEQARQATRQKINDDARGTPAERGYTAEWSKESKAWLASLGAPLCACGCGRKANMVDHRIAPKGNMTLFWDRKNWQPFHFICNRRKAIKSEGGFGRKPPERG